MGIIGNDFAPIWQIFDNYDLYNSRSNFSFIRLMNGLWVEPNFSTVWNNIHTRKAPYLNLKPFENITEQVTKFYNKTMELASDFSLIPVFDTENLLLTAGMISTAWSVGYNKFGNYPMPYSSKNFWPVAYPDYPSVPRWCANYPFSLQGLRFFGSEPKIEEARSAGFPFMPPDWGAFREPGDFWQCSSTGYGPDWGLKWPDSKAIDVDYFDGTMDDLSALVDKWHGIVPTPVPPPSGEIVPLKEVIVTSEGLNIRSLPTASSKDIGTLVKNSQVPVVGQEGNFYRIEGYIHKDYTVDA